MGVIKKPLVSIIVITYNSAKYVLETLESAKNQTYQNIELIISDDCSNDDTSNYIPIQNNNIYININKRNLGYGENIKKCINFAIKKKFDYAVMIHGDNQYDASYIPKLYKIITLTNHIATKLSEPLHALAISG